MSEHHTIWLLILVLALTFGAVFLVNAQTTNVERDFNFSGTSNVTNVGGLSIGTTTVNSGSITFGDGTVFSASDAAANWTSTSTGIFYNGGRVGIGTQNPNNQLHVTGPIYGTILYDQDNTSWLVNPSGQSYFSGNVGVGTTTPSRPLEVDGSIRIPFSQAVEWAGTDDQLWYDSSGFRIKAGGGTKLFVDSGNGNVGIGETSPVFPLTVIDDIAAQDVAGANHSFLRLKVDGSRARLHSGKSGSGTVLPLDLVVGGSSDARMRVDTSGNVGIGTTTPASPLHVSKSDAFMLRLERSGSTGAPHILFDNDNAGTARFWAQNSGFEISQGDSTGSQSGSIWLRGDSNGNIGIGTTVTTSTLSVDGGGWFKNPVRVGSPVVDQDAATKSYVDSTAGGGVPSGTDGQTLYNADGTWTASNNIYVASSTGQVGIGTTNPAARLNVNGSRPVGFVGSPSDLPSGADEDFHIAGVRGGLGLTDTDSFTDSEDWFYLNPAVDTLRFGWKDTSAGSRNPFFYLDGPTTRVGIGDESPTGKLDVNGSVYGSIYYDKDNDAYYINPSGSSNFGGDISFPAGARIKVSGSPSEIWLGDRGGNLETGNSAGDFWRMWDNVNSQNLMVWNEGGPVEVGGNVNLDMNSNDITNADKIDANTVDPVYNIGGTKYATYMAGMTGVKEETTGVAELDCEPRRGPDCTSTIDFSEVVRGSDLWLFFRTSDFGDGWKELRVIVTPQQEGSVWSAGYDLRPQEKRLVLNAEPLEVQEPLNELTPEVSYRLTAPRFDANEWSNYYEGDSEGMTVPVE